MIRRSAGFREPGLRRLATMYDGEDFEAAAGLVLPAGLSRAEQVQIAGLVGLENGVRVCARLAKQQCVCGP